MTSSFNDLSRQSLAPARRLPILTLLAAVGLSASVLLGSGCARGENLLARDQEREAAEMAAKEEDSQVVKPTESSSTTKPADLEAAPVITLTIDEKQIVPSALTTKPGLYRFRVLNRDAEPTYFWLRRQDGSEMGDTFALKTVQGDARNDYHVSLVEGDYLYSAPMPPDAPTFRLTVR